MPDTTSTGGSPGGPALGRYSPGPAPGEPRLVRLLGVPVRLQQRGREHHDGLMREFALLAQAPPVDRPGHDVPQRLLELIELLGRRYGAATDTADAVLEDAVAAGRDTVDLDYVLPPAAGEAAQALTDLLDEADAYCRAGDLLTLEHPPELVAYRHWYCGEMSRQLAGEPPRAWDGPLD